MNGSVSVAGLRARLRPARWAIGVSVGLILASATWIAIRSSLPTDGAPVFVDPGFSRGFTLDVRPDEPSALQRDDVVIAVDGISVDRLLRNLGPEVVDLRAGTELRYRVLRDGEAIEVPVRLHKDGGSVVEHLRETATPVGSLIVLLLGAYTVFRRPEQPAARALLLMGSGLTAYEIFGVVSSDVADLVAARWLFVPGIAGTFIALVTWSTAGAHLVLMFPTAPRALRARPWLIGLLYAVSLIAPVAIAAYLALGHPTLTGLVGIHTLLLATEWALVALFMAGLVRTIARARRDATTRRQAGLVVLGMATTGAILTVGNLVAGGERWPDWLNALAFFPMITALAAAIIRGEFLDVRATVSRAFVYASLTALLLGLFAAVVSLTGALVGRSGVIEALPATAVVAIAFARARARLQRGIDRLFYGERGDPARVLGALGERLEAALPPEQVLPAIVETVALTLRLPYVAIRTTDGETGRLVCERGEPPEKPESVPMVYQGRSVGAILVGPRRGERSINEADRALLGDIARQAAPAVSATSLLTEIAASRDRLAVAREEERARLRHDLHDRLGSRLAALSLQLDTVQKHLHDGVSPDAIRRALAETDLALDEVRRISRGLRPAELDELGLTAAISAAAARLTVGDDESGWRASVRAAVRLPALPKDIEAAAYHIAVEALTNAYRHSRGDTAEVRISVDALGASLLLEISDDGTGIAGAPNHGVGLRSMRERAAGAGGTLKVSSPPHGGTTVRAELPLNGEAPNSTTNSKWTQAV